MINAITIIKKKQGLTYEKFQNYWKNEHATIVTRSPLVGTYVQSHPIYSDTLTFEDTIDGIAEIWFEDTNAMRTLAATKEYRDIQEDEKVFIDGKAVRLIIAEDAIIKEGPVSDYRVLFFLKSRSNIDLQKFRDDCTEFLSEGFLEKVARAKLSLPKLAGYRGDTKPEWDAIFSIWYNKIPNQKYIDEMQSVFFGISKKVIGKLCFSNIIQTILHTKV